MLSLTRGKCDSWKQHLLQYDWLSKDEGIEIGRIHGEIEFSIGKLVFINFKQLYEGWRVGEIVR